MVVGSFIPKRWCRFFLCLMCPLTGAMAAIVPISDEADDAILIEAGIERLQTDGTTDDARLTAAKALLASAEERRERIDNYVARAAKVDVIVAELEDEIASTRAAAVEALSIRTVTAANDSALRPMIALRDERDALDSRLERLRRELDALDRRGPAILRALEASRDEISDGEIVRDPRTSSVSAADVLESARRYERRSAVEALRRELGTIAPRARITAARMRLSEQRRAALTREFEWRVTGADNALLNTANRRIGEIDEQLAMNRESTTDSDRAVLALRLGYAQLLLDLANRGTDLRENEEALQQTRRELVAAEVGARAVLSSGTLNDAQGGLLMRLRREMPTLAILESSLTAGQRDAERLRTRRIIWEDELRRFDRDEAAAETAGALRQLVDIARQHSERVERHTLLLGDTLERAKALGALLDRRLLWLRRSESLVSSLPRDVLAGVRWLADPGLWSESLSTLSSAVAARPLRTIAAAVLAFGLFALRWRLLMLQAKLTERVGHVGNDGYWVTPQAIALVVPLALPLPLAIAATAWPLADAAIGFPKALGIAMLAVATVVFTLGLFRWLARRGSIFITHFGWSEEAAGQLDLSLRRLGHVQIPMTFLLTLTLAGPETRYGLGLIAFIVISIALSAFVWRVCRPHTGVLAVAVPHGRSSLATRLGAVVCVIVPLAVGLLPLAGYLDAAIALQTTVFRSGLILLSGAVVYGLLLRLYAVSLRRYSLRWARERRVERARTRDAAQAGEVLPAAAATEYLAPEPLAGQARIAFLALAVVSSAVGLWWLWAPLLPALGVVDEIVLWKSSVVAGNGTQTTSVTLWSLLLALSLFFAGLLAARNLRGLLQVGLLQRLDFDAGTRYAIVTIAGYLAFGAGLVGGLAQLGIDWSKLQWIVAALGVGLGFGLQEIVANFVSGLIILFERPVRVGDVVTIGNLSGTVSDIRIRATTVTDFENREVLLPNKAIITENVTNWTLRDATTRLLLKLGVAYGSDVEQVRELLDDIVQSHPDVLGTPAPSVFFIGHGPSSLDFELRVFVASTAHRLPTTHDINTSINARFAEAGISIPFPQSDVTVHLPAEGERFGFGQDRHDDERRAA